MTFVVRRNLALITVFAVVVSALAVSTTGAQTPPTPTGPMVPPTPGGPPFTWCEVSTQTWAGGQTLNPTTRHSFDLPADYSYEFALIQPEPGNLRFRICIVEFNSEIFIDGETGLEISRTVNNTSANPVLDQLLMSFKIAPRPTPFPTMTPAATPTQQPPTALPVTATALPITATVRPPDTGDAGLR
jgi:hypothetical protein